jgi:GDPmannose 4,6-dehydratase
MGKRALITGVTGQDGAYLAKFLVERGYEVFGGVRRTSLQNTARLASLGVEKGVKLVDLDLLEFENILRVVERTAPDEIYNLAAQSFVQSSFELPLYTGECDALGVTRLLEAVRRLKGKPRFYQASTSEMFGNADESPQTEKTPFRPRSPYGVAKVYAHWITVNYRESYGMHNSCGILFNHESPLRGQEFVTRKITLGLARIREGLQDAIELGNLDATRDWGFAGDYVAGMWAMLQQDEPDDYVLATGRACSVREFVALAGKAVGFDIEFVGNGMEERGVDRATGRTIVRVNVDLYRPADVHRLIGQAAKARQILNWTPKTSLAELVEMMAEADLRRVRSGQLAF